jgi:nitrate reductase delta subunit
MQTATDLLDALARVFAYPGPEYRMFLTRCEALGKSRRWMNEQHEQEFHTHLRQFSAAIASLSVEELEELYTRTFDINPISSLDIGWHLFGETYDRGTFLVQMRALLRRCGVEESAELPDHLTHVLLALGRMPQDEAAAFISTHLLKALDKMMEGFAGKQNPYEHMLAATHLLVAETAHETFSQEMMS